MGRQVKFHYSAEKRQARLKLLHAIQNTPLPNDSGILWHLVMALLQRIRTQNLSDSYHIETLIQDIVMDEFLMMNDPAYEEGRAKYSNALKRIQLCIKTIATAPSEICKVACNPKAILFQRDEILQYLVAAYPDNAQNTVTLVDWLNARGEVFSKMVKIHRCSCRYPSMFPTLKAADMNAADWHNIGPIADLILSRFHGCHRSYISKLIQRAEKSRKAGVKNLKELTYP